MSGADPIQLATYAAARVRDPVHGASALAAGRVRNAHVEQGALVVEVVFPSSVDPAARRAVAVAFEENVRGLGYGGPLRLVERVDDGPATTPAPASDAPRPIPAPPATHGADEALRAVAPGAQSRRGQPHGGPVEKKPIEGVKRLLAVASGKGGVGKSTVAVNLAVALRRAGHAVGLLDADVYGPSIPRMMDVRERPGSAPDHRLVPPEAHGIRCLSSGMLVEEDQAILWRGPLVMDLVRTFLQKTAWGDLDYLVVDLPPGTGDAQLTLVQATAIDGVLIVTTPQPVALADALRGIAMFRRLEVPLLGLVENMAYYALPDGTRDYVFGNGGGRRLAQEQGTELLAEIPLRTALRESGDEGRPAALGEGDLSRAFALLAARVTEKVPCR